VRTILEIISAGGSTGDARSFPVDSINVDLVRRTVDVGNECQSQLAREVIDPLQNAGHPDLAGAMQECLDDYYRRTRIRRALHRARKLLMTS
jgi:hypothetical protein